MKIEFESREEIQRLAAILQNNIFPASIIIDEDTLLDACNGTIDKPLPWNVDGFHPELKIEPSDDVVDKGGGADNLEDKTFTSEECSYCSYVAGQLDAIFHCVKIGCLSLMDATEVTGRSAPEIGHLYGCGSIKKQKKKEKWAKGEYIMLLNIVLALIFFWIIGWVVHKIMGRDGSFLHFCFIGGAGSGVGSFLEWATGRYTESFLGAIGLCIVCSFLVEYAIRKVKRKLELKRIHDLGAQTIEDIGGNPEDWTIYP